MRKLIIPAMFMFLIIITTVSASLTVTPESLDINTIVGQQKSYEIQIQNNYNFTIYNLTFDSNPRFTSTKIPSIQNNETKSINITFNYNQVENTQISPKIIFYYLVQVTQQPKTVNVSIHDTYYSPAQTTIYQGDTIRFTNLDTITHSVTSSYFDQDIAPNNSWTNTFNNIESVSYYDDIMYFYGQINVLNRSGMESTHNQDYDKILTWNYNNHYADSTMVLEIMDDNITISFGSSGEGLLRVKNNGNQTIYNIRLNATWTTFDENNFTLAPSESNYVEFDVTPMIQTTEESNKTHQITITANSDNTAEISKIFNIFIPYFDFGNPDNSSTSDWWIQKKAFCDIYPTSPFCISEPIIQYVNVTFCNDSIVQYNFTSRDINRYFRELAEEREERLRTENRMSNVVTLVETMFPNYMNNTENSTKGILELLEEYDKRQRNRGVMEGLGICMILLTIIVGILYIKNKSKKRNEKRYLGINK